jgi:aconitase B
MSTRQKGLNTLEEKQRKNTLKTSMFSQVETMKRFCIEQCFDFKDATLSASETACYTDCNGKMKNFLERADHFYKQKYF